MDVDILYYGFSTSGNGTHDLFRPDGFRVTQEENETLPQLLQWRYIDQRFPPQIDSRPQGIASFQHIQGWTVVAFWDRSGDKSLNSNSAFLIKGVYPLTEQGWLAAFALSKDAFPGVFDRLEKLGILTLQCVFNSLEI